MVTTATLNIRCCIVGGGPAGMVAGYLLARSGVDVVIIEKHADFFRDFRGDTIHPSTLRLLDELNLLDDFLALPHSRAEVLSVRFGTVVIPVADFRHVPGRCKFIALVPQWDFLNFFADRARRYPSFRLFMETEAIDVLCEGNRVAGVRATGPNGPFDIKTDLVIAADGRTSTLRKQAGLTVIDSGAPIDVLWLRLSKRPGDPEQSFGNVGPGGLLVTIDRRTYFQCALVIAKGVYDTMRADGLVAFRSRITALAPFLKSRVAELQSWDQVRLLTVRIDHLHKWYRPGLLCIGDAAHAMSPVGGVGINLAIQDAVSTANILTAALNIGRPADNLLARVQRRRELPARVVQRGQMFIQNRVLRPLLRSRTEVSAALKVLQLFKLMPWLQRIPAYIIGFGLRPEHIKTREMLPPH